MPAEMTLPRRSLLRQIWAYLVFDVPIRHKFLLYCTCTAAWYVVLGAVGFALARDASMRLLIVGAVLVSIVPLAGFGVLLTRSLTRPLDLLTNRITSLAEGEADLCERVQAGSDDEVGLLAERCNRLLAVLHEVSAFKRVIEEDDTAQDVYERLGGKFKQGGLDSYTIYEVSHTDSLLRRALCSGGPAETSCAPDILVDQNLCRAKKTGGTVASAGFPGICKHFRASDRDHVCIPMIIGGTTGGVAQFLFPRGEGAGAAVDPDIERKLATARRYIQEALPVLQAKRLTDTLRESTLRDGLTHLYNRRFLDEYSKTLAATTQRHGRKVGLLMCDLDFFKEVNDRHGHDVGDVVLRETSALIANAVRSSDLVCRFGGEEFLVVLQDTSQDAPAAVAERMRASIEAAEFPTPTGPLKKTISIGVAEFPVDTANFWQAVKFADIALYRAKESGRNRVLRFAKEMWTGDKY